jgi:hypothetical protein
MMRPPLVATLFLVAASPVFAAPDVPLPPQFANSDVPLKKNITLTQARKIVLRAGWLLPSKSNCLEQKARTSVPCMAVELPDMIYALAPEINGMPVDLPIVASCYPRAMGANLFVTFRYDERTLILHKERYKDFLASLRVDGWSLEYVSCDS